MIYFNFGEELGTGGMHIGEKFSHYERTITGCTRVQADGDELVQACFILGRPLPKNRVFIFTGNDAQTIYNNWY